MESLPKFRPKNSQLPENQADVMAGAAQNGMHGIAQHAFEVVTAQKPVVFQVADNRFDGIASFQGSLQSARVQAALLPGFVKPDGGDLNAAITQILKGFLDFDAAQNFRLFQAGIQGKNAIPFLRKCLSDSDIAVAAVIGLGKLKAVEARSDIEQFINHPNNWFRQQVKTALTKIDSAKEA